MLWLSRLPGMSAALSGVSCLQLVGGTFLEHPMNGIFDELYGYHVHLAWWYNISSVIILLLLGLVNMVIHIGYLEFVRLLPRFCLRNIMGTYNVWCAYHHSLFMGRDCRVYSRKAFCTNKYQRTVDSYGESIDHHLSRFLSTYRIDSTSGCCMSLVYRLFSTIQDHCAFTFGRSVYYLSLNMFY